MKVSLFIPCYIDQIYPQVGMHSLQLLEKLGVNVHVTKNQTCCGQPAYNSGYLKSAQKLAKRFYQKFSDDNIIISPSSSCIAFLKNEYTRLATKQSSTIETKLKNMFELSDFIVNKLGITDVKAFFPHVVTYQDSCSMLRGYGEKLAPRTLMKNVKGLKLVEMNDPEECCGFGGTFAVKYNTLSSAIGSKKIEQLPSEVEYLITTEASCMLSLDGIINKNSNKKLQTIHLAEVLNRTIVAV